VILNGFTTPVAIASLGEEVRPLILQVPRAAYAGPFRFTLTVTDPAGTFRISREVEFLGPEARLLREEGPAP
jgi:hypothetical protein